VNEVTFEIEIFSRQQMLARVVKVKLQELIARVADDAGRAGIGIDLDCVAVVDNAQRQRLVVIIDRANVALDAASQIDWRLLQAELAHLEIGLQFSPFFRAALAFIAPMRRCASIRRRIQGNGRPGLETTRAGKRATHQRPTIDRHFRTPESVLLPRQAEWFQFNLLLL
jgi:hypothetical protein